MSLAHSAATKHGNMREMHAPLYLLWHIFQNCALSLLVVWPLLWMRLKTMLPQPVCRYFAYLFTGVLQPQALLQEGSYDPF